MQNITDDEYINEWKIVGLTQRSDRRKWLNHNDAMDACRERFTNTKYKILCVEIDLGSKEFWNKPDLHIAAHSSLSALIGIHGAQLAEAVFMPPGSLVVELLPFVPDEEVFGEWTRFVDVPTPLGLIFSDTDLNHIGLPLTVSSAMHIPCVSNNLQQQQQQENYNKTKLSKCFDYEENPWDDRHFTVSVDAIVDILEKFVANGMGKNLNEHDTPGFSSLPSTPASTQPLKYCKDFKRVAGDDYLLYNVNCVTVTDTSAPMTLHHYYRTKEWLENKTHSSLTSSSLL